MNVSAPRALVGRARERQILDRTWADARVGRSQVCVVLGAAGLGKTSLVETWTAELEVGDARVLWGRCWEGGGAPPYWPWMQIVRSLAPADDPQASAWLTPSRGIGDAEDRFTRHEALSRLLEASSRDAPLVVALDDIHAADVASLEALWFLGRGAASGRWLVVATSRPLALGTDGARARIRHEIERSSRRVALAPLDVDAVGELLRSRGVTLEAGDVARVHAVTEGHPLFVEEIVRLGGVVLAGERVESLAQRAVFGAVGEVIRRRLDALPVDTREALGWAAMFGRDFELAEVARISGRSIGELELACRAAHAVEIVEPVGSGAHRFTHGLLREALYRELDAGTRAERHRVIATALRERSRGGWVEVAHHALGSVSAVLSADVIEAVAHAAEESTRALAFEDAEDLWSRASALARTARSDAASRFEIALGLGRSRCRAGSFEAGKADCLEACEVARAMDDPEKFARAALAFSETHRLFHVDPTMVEVLREAEERFERAGDSATPAAARVSARLASALQPADEPGIPIAKARRAIEVARRSGDESLELDVIFAAMGALMDVVPPDERARLNERAADLAERRDDPTKLLRSWARLAIDRLELGAVAEAHVTIEKHAALAERFRQPVHRWRTALFRSARAILDGRFSEAEGEIGRAEEIAKGHGDPNAELAIRAQRIALARARGDPDALRAAEEESVRLFARVPDGERWHALLSAALRAQAGDLDAARGRLDASDLDHPMLRYDTSANVWFGEVVARIGTDAEVCEAYGALVGRRSVLVSWGLSLMIVEGPLADVLGRLAARLGRLEDAARHFERALTAAGAGMGPWRARTLAAYAEVLERQTPGADRAARMRAEAARLAQDLELADLGVGARAPAHGRPAPEPERPAAPLQLSREGAIWVVRRGAEVARVPHSRGMDMLARLVEQPGVEVHVLELAGSAGTDRDWGDAGPALDAEAKRAYQARYRELAAAQDEHERLGQPALAERAREELEALERELTRGLDRRGRPRATGSAAERARVNVQRRLRHALAKIEEVDAALGKRLHREVVTGTFCVYAPID